MSLKEYQKFVDYPAQRDAEALLNLPVVSASDEAVTAALQAAAEAPKKPEEPPEVDGVLRAAVRNGQATVDALNMELCLQDTDCVHCPPSKAFISGEDYGMDFPIRAAHRDFQLKFVFKMEFRHATGASLMFSSGITHKHEQHIGLDGPGSVLYLEGGSFGHLGPSTMFGPAPTANEVHTLIVTRIDECVNITLDGELAFPELIMPASVGTVTVRPWKNRLQIYEFELMKPEAWTKVTHTEAWDQIEHPNSPPPTR